MSEQAVGTGALDGGEGKVTETCVPARLDRLPWSRWHWMVIIALGVTWILDGFEVTLVGALAAVLTEKDTLALTTSQSADLGTFYLAGACGGALLFGYLTDRLGRKVLFMVTLGVYMLFTALSGFAWDYWSLVVFRVLAGAGIGGEYAAINSAIDELIPARVRGRVALSINGSWWVGTAAAAIISYSLLTYMSQSISWRLGFFVGVILALGIIIIRRFIPESPRWLLTHGRADEAEEVVGKIEQDVMRYNGLQELPPVEGEPLHVEQRKAIGFGNIVSYVVREYPGRGILGLSLMVGQAFFYNAIFFTYTLVLATFFEVDAAKAPLFLIPFAIGNVLGPWLLGPLFDSIGRRAMIASTYIVSGALLLVTGALFVHGSLDETTMTILWSVTFFFASAGASAAYLTVSELFPMEARAMAIALFYAVGTGIAMLSPTLFGRLIASEDKMHVYYGYILGAVLMIGAGLVAVALAVKAERRSLEDIARPLTAVRAKMAHGDADGASAAGVRAR